MRNRSDRNSPQPESSFHNFFINTLEGIFQTSPEGELLAANPALARILGYDSADELVRSMKDVATQAYIDPKRRSTFLRIMKKKGALANFESQMRKKDGSPVWVKENVWTVKNKAGKILYFEGTIHDISARKNVEHEREKLLHERIAREEAEKIKNEMSRLYKNAREGIRARDEFLNIAAHELRTPLTSLQLQVQLLRRMAKKEIDRGKLERALDASEMQVKRLTKLINNLLDVSRISNKKLILEKEKTDLHEVIEEVLARLENAYKTSGSRIKVVNGKKVTGLWDKSKIDQVATNLISNAIKYGEGKPISVIVDGTKERAELIVRDHGIGIKKADKERIFDRFARSHVAKKYGGLGLGLYITKQIVTAHGGSIAVKSMPKKGTEFTVRLPIERS